MMVLIRLMRIISERMFDVKKETFVLHRLGKDF